MLSLEQMSPAEVHFIRTYVAALRRDPELLQTVFELMHPDELGITDIVQATNMAAELSRMHDEFNCQLGALSNAKVVSVTVLSMATLSDLFSMSFFKLVKVLSQDNKPVSKQDIGWFSGEPKDWESTLKASMSVPDAESSPPKKLLDLLKKYFPKFNSSKYAQDQDHPDIDKPFNFWPPKKKPLTGHFGGYDDDGLPDDDDPEPHSNWFPYDD